MYQIDFNRPVWVHFIGIGGISMSGLAEVLLGRNFKVSGSDMHASPLTDRLQNEGAQVAIGQRAENIVDGIDVVVYTAAVHSDNPEFAEAVRRELPMLTRAELLGQMMKNYGTAVAVAGTHG
ncbi:MAG: UDP-N-acetylmuramate--L-alanine ligase, partial [Lachnospiraceae bacterium]|nr:UDP-N-acetylmuramate--L-alanine ligase [Lachnospiraceae bacterium]